MSLYQIPVHFHTHYLDIKFYQLQPLCMVKLTVHWCLVFGKICFKKGKTFSNLKVEDTFVVHHVMYN